MIKSQFTLALSSGFFGFYAHVGFLKALDKLNLQPSIYSGSSAGAIVATAAAKGMTVKEIEKLVLGVSRKEFWDPGLGFGFLQGRKMQNLFEREFGNHFDQLQKPLRISVFDMTNFSTQVFTSGELGRVIRASCAVPFMFHPVRINKKFYCDGGVLDKMAVHGLDFKENIISHYLESSSRDLHGLYELKRDQKVIQSRGKNLNCIQLKNLPQAHPFALDHGKEIIDQAYKKSLIALKEIKIDH